MARKIISFTEPNDEWLKAQVKRKDYSSKSELVRQARSQRQELNWLKAKLKRAEKNRFTSDGREGILKQASEQNG